MSMAESYLDFVVYLQDFVFLASGLDEAVAHATLKVVNLSDQSVRQSISSGVM